MEYTSNTFKFYVSEDKDAYIELKSPSQELLVLLGESELRKGEVNAITRTVPILRHVEKRIVRVHNIVIDGSPADPKEFLNWPGELINDVLSAYIDALTSEVNPSDKDESEKNS